MKIWTLTGTVIVFAALAAGAESREKVDRRIQESATVFNEITKIGDKGIPSDILQQAKCVGIVPNMKQGGFIVGAKYGKGVLMCRQAEGARWSAPSVIRIEGGSVGLQIGAGETDLVFAVMNERGVQDLLQDKFTIGGEGAAMAGPVGRTAQAQTDAQMHAGILSWSRSRGAFAGIALTGSTLRPDKEDNETLYGSGVTQHDILMGNAKAPAVASPLYTALNRFPSTARSGEATRRKR